MLPFPLRRHVVVGNFFSVAMGMDVTIKGAGRMPMDEIVVFEVKDGKIIATGTSDDLLKTYSAKEIIDVQGKAVYPGFIDAHAHFLGYGQSLFQVSLFGCNSWGEVVERVKDFAAKHPDETWIKGRGWDQNKWADKAFPNNEKLNILFPNKPAFNPAISKAFWFAMAA